jgi:hypothetical protein
VINTQRYIDRYITGSTLILTTLVEQQQNNKPGAIIIFFFHFCHKSVITITSFARKIAPFKQKTPIVYCHKYSKVTLTRTISEISRSYLGVKCQKWAWFLFLGAVTLHIRGAGIALHYQTSLCSPKIAALSVHYDTVNSAYNNIKGATKFILL